MTDALGHETSYTYDEAGRLTSETDALGNTVKYSYTPEGWLETVTDAEGHVTRYTYDEVGNLVSQTTTGAYDLALEYAYDLSGRMTSESRTENGATLESVFTYDPLGQLTDFTRNDGQSESYAYDAVGNMLTKSQNGVKTRMGYNAANQLTRSVTDGETTRYTYDANGNLVKSENAGGARSYAYNALNLLQSFTREDGYTETYTYNANRLLSTVTTSEDLTTTLTWDILYGDGVVISAAQNGQTTNFTYGLERISALTGNNRTEYLYDGRGSVAAEVSYNNAWYTFGGGLARKNITTKSYTPFGEQIGEAVSGFGYNGEYYNAATGMIYLRARFYAPEMNRFAQKDLLRGSALEPQTLNRYSYCWNDPINFIDPSGQFGLLAATLICAGVSALIAGGASAYQSYKTTGEVDWKQAGKAALGGAGAAAAVGLAVATGGTGLGLATMAVEAYAGTKTAMRGGNMADVTTSMANAGTMTVVAANILPVLPSAAKAAIGVAGMVGSAVKGVRDVKKAVNTFKDPTSTVIDRVLSVMDVTEDAFGFATSTALAYNGISGMVADAKAANSAAPKVEGPQPKEQAAGCGENGKVTTPKPYSNGRPSFRKGIVETVWENAKGPDGIVRDPNTGEVIEWTPGESRRGVWDMGHIPEAKYSEMHDAYMNGEMTTKEFVDWYNDPSNYRPEIPSNNRSHIFE